MTSPPSTKPSRRSIRRLRRLDLLAAARRRCADALAEFAGRLPGRYAGASRRGAISTARAREIDALVSSSQSATGALQAAQSGNQLVALQTKQLADLTAVMAAIARAQSLEGARNVESEEQAQEQLQRFLDYGPGYQPPDRADVPLTRSTRATPWAEQASSISSWGLHPVYRFGFRSGAGRCALACGRPHRDRHHARRSVLGDGADEDVLARLIKKTLYIGVFAFIIGNFNSLAEIIFNSFAGLGLVAGGGTLTPAQLLQPGRLAQVGIDAGKPILDSISAWWASSPSSKTSSRSSFC